MASAGDGRTSTSQSLERGLAILTSFSSGRQLIGVSDLSRELGLTRSTTHRYVATLARLGYLQQEPVTRKYSLGPRRANVVRPSTSSRVASDWNASRTLPIDVQ